MARSSNEGLSKRLLSSPQRAHACARCIRMCSCRFAQYCSAFADVDGPFGSHGSFFDLIATEGSFEANPPFIPELMHRAIVHIEDVSAPQCAAPSRATVSPAPLHVCALTHSHGAAASLAQGKRRAVVRFHNACVA